MRRKIGDLRIQSTGWNGENTTRRTVICLTFGCRVNALHAAPTTSQRTRTITQLVMELINALPGPEVPLGATSRTKSLLNIFFFMFNYLLLPTNLFLYLIVNYIISNEKTCLNNFKYSLLHAKTV